VSKHYQCQCISTFEPGTLNLEPITIRRLIMKKTALICVLSVVTFLMAGLSASAQDGERLYVYKFCTTCHGQKGQSIAPNYPNLAKQNERYLVNQVKDIIAKKRANKLTLLMTEHPVVTGVSDEEIAAIAAHMTNMK
jgi:cytochrome c553